MLLQPESPSQASIEYEIVIVPCLTFNKGANLAAIKNLGTPAANDPIKKIIPVAKMAFVLLETKIIPLAAFLNNTLKFQSIAIDRKQEINKARTQIWTNFVSGLSFSLISNNPFPNDKLKDEFCKIESSN